MKMHNLLKTLAKFLLGLKDSNHLKRMKLLFIDKKDSSFEEILEDLFRIGAENLRKTENKVPHRCNDKTVDITDYENSDHKDGELPDLPIFSATNEFASVCEHVVENIDISIAKEKQKVLIEDTEMDENHNIDHSGTKEALQWSLAKDPFLVVMELNDLSSSGSKGTKFEVTSTRGMW
nr:hypothetical protein [Tanacetum cinerariifolium]